LVAGSGVVYAIMKYLMEPVEEWSVVNHPWQPHLQHLHVVAAPLLVFAVALYFKGHVVEKVSNGSNRGRFTGYVLALHFVPVVLSGYLIQVTVDERWRMAWIWVHLVTGGLWILGALAHRFKKNNGETD